MISDFYKCIFVAVPKTGSTSIRRLIEGREGKAHMNICQIKQITPPVILKAISSLDLFATLGIEWFLSMSETRGCN